MRVMIQLRHSKQLHTAAVGFGALTTATLEVESQFPGLTLDHRFAAVQIPKPQPTHAGASPFELAQPLSFSMQPEESSYIVRGQISDDPDGQRNTLAAAYSNPNVTGVFSDPAIESCPICPGDPALGTDNDVAKLLDVPTLAAAGMDGT